MKITNGVDIIEVERIEKMISEHGQIFLDKLFTEEEQQYCESVKAHKFESYSSRFTAKEATFKALDLDGADEINWKDIEVYNLKTGRPAIKLSGRLKELEDKICNLDISMSHLENIAISTVIVLWK